MSRLILLFILLFAVKGHAQADKVNCDWSKIEIDKYGCVDFFWYNLADKANCANMPQCFKFQVEEVDPKHKKSDKKHKKNDDLLEIPEVKKEFFKGEDVEEKKKIMPILDSSALALLKNSKLKDIKIIFYNKTGKLSKDFQKEAEQYLLDKGVKQDQFKIEIRN